jgi:tRNA A37 methylthiotransferase MiaB
VVPFTRGRERSRPISSILEEVALLRDQGYKDITLLGQNVNSYHDKTSEMKSDHQNSSGFNEMFKNRTGDGARFADLLAEVASIAPEVRFRFTSPHPKDFPDPLLDVIGQIPNICRQIHLPAQSGNTDMLMRMRRNHTREAYLELVGRIRERIPGVALSSDFIAGF